MDNLSHRGAVAQCERVREMSGLCAANEALAGSVPATPTNIMSIANIDSTPFASLSIDHDIHVDPIIQSAHTGLHEAAYI